MMRPIFCGNFEYDARQSDLERLFRRYGRVERVDMKSGFAFIYMEDERDAEDAIRGLDRSEFGQRGRRLRVEWTKHERGIRRPGSSKRSSTSSKPSKTLFVINFDPYNTRTKDLERHFDPYGMISSVRIRRNFAFVQYESLEDATKALEATNMSKLMDRVISVEFAIRDDDERKHSPNRSRDRSPDRRNYDRRRSPSPYRRERGSPDYGQGSSPNPYRRERASPDYGRGRSISPYRRDGASPDYGRGSSRSPYNRREKPGPDHGRGSSRSPYSRREKPGTDHGHVHSRSPYRREKPGTDHGRVRSRSPYRMERASPDNGRGPSHSPYQKEKSIPENGRGPGNSPYRRERDNSENGRDNSISPYSKDRGSPDNRRGPSPTSMPEPGVSPDNFAGAESPMPERYDSDSPPGEE